MDRRIGIGTPHRLLVGGNDVIVLVPIPVVVHRTPLGKLARLLHRDKPAAVLPCIGREGEELDGVERLADVAAAGGGDKVRR